jgi:hypothetical protein
MTPWEGRGRPLIFDDKWDSIKVSKSPLIDAHTIVKSCHIGLTGTICLSFAPLMQVIMNKVRWDERIDFETARSKLVIALRDAEERGKNLSDEKKERMTKCIGMYKSKRGNHIQVSKHMLQM